MGKGDQPRPNQTTREEYELRVKYCWGEISLDEYNRQYEELLQRGLIKRSGRVIK